MSASIAPLAVSLEVDGEAFEALSYSEAGLTLSTERLTDSAQRVLQRGKRVAAVLRLETDGFTDYYPVHVRLASRSPFLIELAFTDLPPQARLRIRHAASSSAPDFDLEWSIDDGEPEPGLVEREDDTGRHLALGYSRAVWEVTERRRPSRARSARADAGSESGTSGVRGMLAAVAVLAVAVVLLLAAQA